MVTDKSERMSMKVLVVLCDIVDSRPSDMLTPTVMTARAETASTGWVTAVSELTLALRPDRPRITNPVP